MEALALTLSFSLSSLGSHELLLSKRQKAQIRCIFTLVKFVNSRLRRSCKSSQDDLAKATAVINGPLYTAEAHSARMVHVVTGKVNSEQQT